MACPHMAGIAALCHRELGSPNGPCQTKTPAQNIVYLRNQADDVQHGEPELRVPARPDHVPVAGVYYGFLSRAPNPLP